MATSTSIESRISLEVPDDVKEVYVSTGLYNPQDGDSGVGVRLVEDSWSAEPGREFFEQRDGFGTKRDEVVAEITKQLLAMGFIQKRDPTHSDLKRGEFTHFERT